MGIQHEERTKLLAMFDEHFTGFVFSHQPERIFEIIEAGIEQGIVAVGDSDFDSGSGGIPCRKSNGAILTAIIKAMVCQAIRNNQTLCQIK